MGDIGAPELLIILAVVVVLFGAKRLPDAARSFGRSLRIFKSEVKGLREDDVSAPAPPAPTPVTPAQPVAAAPIPAAAPTTTPVPTTPVPTTTVPTTTVPPAAAHEQPANSA
ncbi:Sec-independent protein translocase subunit TatA [Frankia sp. AgB32]|uniref:Sec-independent protein translocase subunit TatA n=1 Tax=Frankia sp. AgB32 TaxID=631119 RepID=UPI00200D5770|nr:Sec-independent protein translocase subunit TatA [Frankia sp. AgB32]MCK9896765.1 Sec-independent protein translocase subunit TatA [Frankia sp. AgB32]